MVIDTAGRAFPGPKRPGLIEATSLGSGMASCRASFPGRSARASLKRDQILGSGGSNGVVSRAEAPGPH